MGDDFDTTKGQKPERNTNRYTNRSPTGLGPDRTRPNWKLEPDEPDQKPEAGSRMPEARPDWKPDQTESRTGPETVMLQNYRCNSTVATVLLQQYCCNSTFCNSIVATVLLQQYCTYSIVYFNIKCNPIIKLHVVHATNMIFSKDRSASRDLPF